MPYSTDWFIPNQVIYAHFSAEITVEEMRSCLRYMQRMVDGSEYPYVHIIFDIGDVTTPVPPKKSLEVVKEMGDIDRIGWNILIHEPSAMVKMSVAFGSSVFRSHIKAVETFEEAEEFLQEIDGGLTWEYANRAILASR